MNTTIRFIPQGYTHTPVLLDHHEHYRAQQRDFLLAYDLRIIPSQQKIPANPQAYHGPIHSGTYLPSGPASQRNEIAVYETPNGVRLWQPYHNDHLREKAWEAGLLAAVTLKDLACYTSILEKREDAETFLSHCLSHRPHFSKDPTPSIITHQHHHNPRYDALMARIAAWEFQHLLPPVFWQITAAKGQTKAVHEALKTGWSDCLGTNRPQGSINPEALKTLFSPTSESSCPI